MKILIIKTESGALVKKLVIVEERNNVVFYNTTDTKGKRFQKAIYFDTLDDLNLSWEIIDVEEKKPVVRWLWAILEGDDCCGTSGDV